jgi:hypothetical protein
MTAYNNLKKEYTKAMENLNKDEIEILRRRFAELTSTGDVATYSQPWPKKEKEEEKDEA